MNFRRWVVFTFLVHALVLLVDKGGGLVLYLLCAAERDQHGKSSIAASLPFILGAVANLGLATSLVYFVRKRRYTPQVAFETAMGVALVWGGLVAMIGIAAEALRKQSLRAFLILYFYLGFAFCWIVIPRKVAFYYYYYPAGMILGLACTYWLLKLTRDWMIFVALGATFGFFYYFFPILAALPIPSNSFIRWMWFPTWI